MNWLPPEYRILYSSFDTNINKKYEGDAFQYVFDKLKEFCNRGALFFSLEDIIAIGTEIEIKDNKICFVLAELKPNSLYPINSEEYEVDVNIEGHQTDKIRIERISNILDIRRKHVGV